jgi:hypothetical protein
MRRQRSRLASPPVVVLYCVAAVAVGLRVFRARLGQAKWFPVAIGLTAAAGLIALIQLLDQYLAVPKRPRRLAVFFAICACLGVAGARAIVADAPLIAAGGLGLATVFAYAAAATLFGWPGFRPPPGPDFDGCPRCGYDLTGNVSGRCPECGFNLSLSGNSATQAREGPVESLVTSNTQRRTSNIE